MRSYSIIDNKKPVIKHDVNLSESSQSIQLVRSCYIDIKGRKRLFGTMGAAPNDIYDLYVECESDEKLIVNNKKKLLLINMDGKRSDKLSCDVKTNKVDFQLLFNPNEIIDCHEIEAENSSFSVKYSIKLAGTVKKERKVLCHIDGEILVSLARLNNGAPFFEFEPNETGNNLIYSITQTEPLYIGDLKVRHSGSLLRCPLCNVDFNIICKETDGKPYYGVEAGFLFMKDEVKQSHPRTIVDGRLAEKNSEETSDFKSIIRHRSGSLTNLVVNKISDSAKNNDNFITIPLYWDMTRVGNPTTSVLEYTMRVEMRYSHGPNLMSTAFQDFSVILKKNTKQMDLEVVLLEGANPKGILKNGRVSELLVPEMIAGAKTTYAVILKNTAEAVDIGKENAGIYIHDFQINLPTPGTFTYKENVDVGSHLFTQTETSIEDKLDSMYLGINESRSYVFEYDHTCIDEIHDETGNIVFKREINIPFKFSYFIDKEGEYLSVEDIADGEWRTFRSSLRLRIEKEPAPEWLCIDYGTSAIVGTYGAMTVDEHGTSQDRLLELSSTKKIRMNKWYKDDKDKRTDNTETDNNLITSAVVVNINKNNLSETDVIKANNNVKEYIESPIWLSPTSGMLSIYSRLLPSLKTLIGNKNMPEQLLPQGVTLQGNLTVNSLFKLIYNQLFTLFLPENVRKTNKLILTIPNTYAPCHIEILKELAHRSLPKLRHDYLRFISESDAVAFFYLSRKNEFISNTKEKLNIDFSQFNDFDSKVLVYDMGAGTLDLTYFEQERIGEKNHICIKGKMGVTKAGNYLDYLLADIIVNSSNELKEKLGKSLSLQIRQGEFSDENETAALKNYVRNIVKPMLNDGEDKKLDDFELRKGNKLKIDLTVGEIIGHPDFQQYLKDVSDNVFQHFKALFPEVKPKLVIFSGRTASLNCIRTAVNSALETLCMISNECLYLDLSTGLINQGVIVEKNKNVSNLKTVVANGALAFCSDFSSGKGNYVLHNKNVYAQYGVIFKIGNEWIWENLIDSDTEPINSKDESLSEYGYSIYEYDSSIHDASERELIGNFVGKGRCRNRDFTSVSAAYIVQSYSKDTLNDWSTGERDMISVIGYADLSNVNGNKSYKLTIERDNSLHFYVGAAQMTLFAHDEYETVSFKKSMWPVVRR